MSSSGSTFGGYFGSFGETVTKLGQIADQVKFDLEIVLDQMQTCPPKMTPSEPYLSVTSYMYCVTTHTYFAINVIWDLC